MFGEAASSEVRPPRKVTQTPQSSFTDFKKVSVPRRTDSYDDMAALAAIQWLRLLRVSAENCRAWPRHGMPILIHGFWQRASAKAKVSASTPASTEELLSRDVR